MADERNEGQERTEQATPKRREDSRRRGQVPRSRELTTSAQLIVSVLGLAFLGPAILDGLGRIMREQFTAAAAVALREASLWPALAGAMGEALAVLAPFLALAAAVAALAPLALGGWAPSASQVAIKAERLDPIKGLGRVFSWRGLMELAKALAKFVLITAVALGVLWAGRDQMLGLGGEGLRAGLAHAGRLVSLSFLVLCASTLLIAAVDVPFQLWSHSKQLRMTRQEVKDELKHTEGHPEVKSRVRSLQRELANRRMMEAVPEADVVVTNPEHYAVALRYEAASMGAPRVVAKGAGPIAVRIREIAAGHGVALLHAAPLARAIYFSTEVDGEVPVGLYKAVARVLAWAYQLRQGGGRGWQPPPPSDFEIPPDLAVDPGAPPPRGRARRRS